MMWIERRNSADGALPERSHKYAIKTHACANRQERNKRKVEGKGGKKGEKEEEEWEREKEREGEGEGKRGPGRGREKGGLCFIQLFRNYEYLVLGHKIQSWNANLIAAIIVH